MLKPEESSSNDQRMDQDMIGFLESLSWTQGIRQSNQFYYFI